MATTKPIPNSKRVYQVWKGNNKFFCGGRLIFGPDIGSLYLSVALISGPAVTFCLQTFLKMHSQRTREDDDRDNILGLPVLIVTLLVLILDLIFLFLTSSRDPGIVPRNTRPPDYDDLNIKTLSMEWINGRTPHLRLPRTKDVSVNGFTVKVKYCDTCLLYRPPRVSHCSVCNNCVQKFDHHCPWVDQCIGLRNYRFFYLFISTSTFLCAYVFVLSWANIFEEKARNGISLWKSMTREAASLVLIAYTFVSVWFVGGLTVFHTYLISRNQTTYENFRYRYEKKENPYNKGVLRNFVEVFFSRIPPSMNDFRSWAVEETITSSSFADRSWAVEETIASSSFADIAMDVTSPKEKVDVELGGSTYIETILRNIDYATIDFDIDDEQDTLDGDGEEVKDSITMDELVPHVDHPDHHDAHLPST